MGVLKKLLNKINYATQTASGEIIFTVLPASNSRQQVSLKRIHGIIIISCINSKAEKVISINQPPLSKPAHGHSFFPNHERYGQYLRYSAGEPFGG